MAINVFDGQSPVAMASEVYGVPLPGIADSGLPPSMAAFSQAKNAGFQQMVGEAKTNMNWDKALKAIMGAMAIQPYNYGGAPQAPSSPVRLGDAPKAKNAVVMPAPKPVAMPSLAQLISGGR